MRTLLAGFASLELLFAAGAAFAAPVSAPHLRVDLVSEQKSVQLGHRFWAGLEFQLEDGWHIYWRNAGDSGEGPRIRWSLPPGFTAGEIQWPAPSRLPAPPLVNYGYENQVLLMVPIDVPRSLPSGGEIELKANVRWLVCREVCIPGKADLSRSLDVSKGPPRSDPEAKPFFDDARARLPRTAPSSWKVVAEGNRDGFVLRLSANDPALRSAASTAVFFPLEPDQIENSAPQNPRAIPGGIEFRLRRSDQLSTKLQRLKGVLALNASERGRSFIVDAPMVADTGPVSSVSEGVRQNTASLSNPSGSLSHEVSQGTPGSLAWMLIFAFMGGVILNLMPCVFPVLFIKVLSFVSTSREERSRLRLHGLAYTAGILVSFWALVGALMVLRAGGRQLGWGFQLQSPAFVAALASLLFLFGLNLAGVFEFGSSLAGVGSSLARKEGLRGSFFTGVLATLVATPCTAPFMGSAVGFALSQGVVVSFLVFTVLAIGLALPYLLLSIEPSLGRVLPRPGRWMETLKQAVSFPVFATVLWLGWVFGMQAGMEGLFRLLAGLLVAGSAAWVVGRWARSRGAWAVGAILMGLSLAISLSGARSVPESSGPAAASYDGQASSPARSASAGNLEWEKFAPEKIDGYRSSGRPVFVDFTAAWCVSCKVNELLVFHSDEVKSELKRRNFVLMKADWTTYDPVITRTLAEFGRSGVPLYVIYPADRSRDPIVLPEIINSGIVLRGLSQSRRDNNASS